MLKMRVAYIFECFFVVCFCFCVVVYLLLVLLHADIQPCSLTTGKIAYIQMFCWVGTNEDSLNCFHTVLSDIIMQGLPILHG